MEESLRFKEQELEKAEGVLRRANESNAETKKKLMQAEVKIRQLTQATVKDLKLRLKQKHSEIEVLKEMVKSSSNQIKAKDIDISRLNGQVSNIEEELEQLKKGSGDVDGLQAEINALRNRLNLIVDELEVTRGDNVKLSSELQQQQFRSHVVSRLVVPGLARS